MAPSMLSGRDPGHAAPTDRRACAAAEVLLGEDGPSARFASRVAARRVEYDAIVDMLVAHATPGVPRERTEAVARAIAAGCLGEEHLWRDLRLPHRRALRGLFETFFEPFAADNVMDMRWKKFIYKRLCRWGGFNTCRAPSCSACASYEECFGPGA